MGNLRSNASFLRLFFGRLVTNAGDSLYAVAAMWLVWDLTGSSFYTGVAGFLTFGTQPLQVFVGPLVDRWPLRRVLVSTQVVQLVGVLVVPIAAWTGHLSVWLLLVLMPVLEFLNQFVYPAQHAALPRIVDDDQLVRANSLFSFAYQGVDMVFNAAAGALIAVVGAVTLYLVDAVTFAVALVLFVGLAVPDASTDDGSAAGDAAAAGDAPANDDDYRSELRAGFDYVRGSVVFAFLLGGMIVNFAYGMAMVVLPAFAATLGGPEVYGLLTAAMAAGSLAGAAGASLIEEFPYGRVEIVARLVSALCLFGAIAASGLAVTVGLFFASFVPSGATGVMSSSMLQSAVDDSVLGRVMSVRNSVSTLMMPVGSLLGGTAATYLGSATVIAGLAVASVFLALYFLARPRLRSLPPVDEADETVLGLRSAVEPTDGVESDVEGESPVDGGGEFGASDP